MITDDYILNFKSTEVYQILKDLLIQKKYTAILSDSVSELKTTNYDNSQVSCSPALVIMSIHVLTQEDGNDFHDFFQELLSIEITSSNICLLLEYLEVLENYKVQNLEFSKETRQLRELLLIYSKSNDTSSINCSPLFQRLLSS